MKHILHTGALICLAAACESDLPVAESGSWSAILVVGNPADLNASEHAVQNRLRGAGATVRVVDDGAALPPADCDVLLLSKTSQSETVGDRLKDAACGIVFWEDNQQMLGMLATIHNDGSRGTAWHSIRDEVIVNAAAPGSLRANLSGTIDFYTDSDEITWAPDGELAAGAIVIAELGEPTAGRTAIYAIEEDGVLADGTRAAGRRVYFGLYDDTFTLLTPHGLALFDAAVAWARSR
jgi:hypothetical protein